MNHKTIESNIARYNELQPAGLSKFSPRVGSYFIQEVFEDSKHLTIYKAKALWKERESEVFIEGAQVIIQLTSFQETAQDPRSFNPDDLLNQTVVISDTFLSEIVYKTKTYPILKCVWTITTTTPAIYKQSKPIPSFLNFGGSLLEILHQFQQSLDSQTLAALQNEENSLIEQAYLVEEYDDPYLEDSAYSLTEETGTQETSNNPF